MEILLQVFLSSVWNDSRILTDDMLLSDSGSKYNDFSVTVSTASSSSSPDSVELTALSPLSARSQSLALPSLDQEQDMH